MSEYYSIITDAGAALEAAAAAGGPPVALTQFAVGDGGGAAVIPNPTQVALVNEVYRGSLSSLTTGEQPNVLVAQGIIPMESGGYTIREVGIFTQDGTLYSVSNYPDQVKPAPDSGYAAKLGIEYLLQVSSTSDITLIVSPQDYLTEERANTLYLRIGNNLSEIAAAGAEAQQESRDHLGLGTASTHPVQMHLTDSSTEGAVLMNGSWGLGGPAIRLDDPYFLSTEGHPSTIFTQGGGPEDDHFGPFGAGVHILYGGDATVVHTANLFVTSAGQLTVEWLVIDKATGAISIQNRQALFGTLNPPSASQITEGHVVGRLSADSFEQHGVLLPGTIQTYMPVVGDFDTAPYGWSMCSGLLTGPDAPSPSFGTLLTLSSNGTGGNTSIPPQSVGHWVQQIFYTTDGRIFNRYRTNETPFSPWIMQYSTQNPQPADGIVDMALSALVWFESAAGTTEYLPGWVITGGGDFGADNGSYYARQPMVQWVTGAWTAVGVLGLKAKKLSSLNMTLMEVPEVITAMNNFVMYEPDEPKYPNAKYLISDEGWDWYEAKKKIAGRYLIGIEAETGRVISCADNVDAFWPEGHCLRIIDELPAGFKADGTWVFDGVNFTTLQIAQPKTQVELLWEEVAKLKAMIRKK